MRKGFWGLTFLLILLTVFFFGETVESKEKSKLQAESKVYHEMEKEYLKSTRELLEKYGYKNSGVNMTKIIDEKGKRTYTVKIHNSKINALKETEKNELMESLQTIRFADEDCDFYHEFLVVSKE